MPFAPLRTSASRGTLPSLSWRTFSLLCVHIGNAVHTVHHLDAAKVNLFLLRQGDDLGQQLFGSLQLAAIDQPVLACPRRRPGNMVSVE